MKHLDRPPDPPLDHAEHSPRHTVTDHSLSLDGKTAFITGGASGIGAALAHRLSSLGASVVIADLDPAGQRVAESIGGIFITTDVTRRDENHAAIQVAAEHFGRVDIAVLNAGIGEQRSFLDAFDPDHYRQLVAVNLDGVVFGMDAALEHFIPQGSGAVLAAASLAGIVASPVNPLYAATKHAVVGLVRSIAPSVIDRGVTVNALCPTFVDTPILQGFAPQLTAAGLAVLEPDDVADVAEAALSSGLTGHAWPVVPGGSAPWPFPDPPDLTPQADHTYSESTS